jgi:hypothetical protein
MGGDKPGEMVEMRIRRKKRRGRGGECWTL